MLTAEEVAAIKLLAEVLVKAIRLDNTVILDCEQVFSAHNVPKFRWPLEGTMFLEWAPYNSATDFKLLYVDQAPDVGEMGPMTNATEAQRAKYKHLLECMAFMANLLNTLLA